MRDFAKPSQPRFLTRERCQLATLELRLQCHAMLEPTCARYLDRGKAYEKMDRADLARSDYLRSIELEPDQGDTYSQLGLLDIKDGKFDMAKGNFTKVIDYYTVMLQFGNALLFNILALAYRNRAKVYEAKGDKALAQADQDKANEMEKKAQNFPK